LGFTAYGSGFREIGILLPNNQRQHHTVQFQKDVLPYGFRVQGLGFGVYRVARPEGVDAPNLRRVPRRSTTQRATHSRTTISQKCVKRFRGGFVFKAHRLLYPSTLGLRVIKKKKKKTKKKKKASYAESCGG